MEQIVTAYLGTEWLPVIAALVVLANGLMMVLSSKSENPIWQVCLDVLNWASLNLAKNKSKDQ